MTTDGGYESLRIRARVSRLVVMTLLLLALAGCSINSEVNPPKGMRCVAAHDDQDAGHAVCDSYSPVPEATP